MRKFPLSASPKLTMMPPKNSTGKDVPMRIFFSVGEPSGDVHGANLIRALAQRRSDLDFVGFGGNLMAQAGCDHLFPLCNHPVMGFSQVFSALPQFMSLISQADRYFSHHRPAAVVLIDYPGFNWWIARRAHYHGIPVFYFVPPQIWAWASWRVKRMRRWVDHVLCSLPFEEAWYRARGVAAEYVGHPFFDELPRQQLDPVFMDAQRQQGGTIVGLLPGSRTQEVERNFLSQLRAAEMIHRARPETRFLVACFKESQQKLADAMCRQFPSVPAQTFVGKTPEIIEASKACVAVSGSVSLELLYRAKPTVIVYRLSKMMSAFLTPLVKAKYITLVNLLADKMLFPEFPWIRCQAPAVSEEVLRWLNDERAHAELCRELLALRERCARPGACDRAAERIMEVLERRQLQAA
jgi:lipid-A-disaccharide synthase